MSTISRKTTNFIPITIPSNQKLQHSPEKPSTILDATAQPFQANVAIAQNTSDVDFPSRSPKRWQTALTEGIYNAPNFSIAKLKPVSSIDPVTRRWIRTASDERAAQEGCRFSEKRGQFTVDWVENYCTLYEGDKAGQHLEVDDWQYEYFMQVFGWIFYSTDYNRWIRRFTAAGVWIPKKNAKSPTLAATGLYMLCGDGEQGQKCYSVARDGKQAMIAHAHAMEMVRSSGPLLQVCKVNASTGTITHQPSRSKYIVVSGENRQSTEGFNGSLFVDEIHVVNQNLMDRLKRATISRSEPLHIEMSTAGDSGDGYGYSRYEYGKQIAACERDEDYNPNFYFLDFSVPKETPVEKLRDKEFVIRIGKIANPTLGRILTMRGFESDWRDSIQSQTELRKFAMYRLNLWTASGANWIDLEDWLACKRKYKLSQLKDYPCVGGLDLSKTRDMTAFSLIWAVPDTDFGVRPYTWTWQWIPEEAARRYSSKVDLYRWAEKDTLIIVPGKTVDYEIVANRINWAVEQFDLKGVAYDQYYSKTLMDILYREYGWTEEMMTPIRQNMSMLAPATAELERLILRNEIVYNGNPVLNWQFGHCQVKEDGMGNKMPMKPQKDDYRKIDGIASLVNATALFYTNEEIQSGYDDSMLLYRQSELTEQDE